MSEDLRRLITDKHATARRMADSLARDFDAMVDASATSNTDDEHDPEGATIAFERAQLDATLAQTRRQVTELAEALERLDAGTFGICARCGQPIPYARLEVRPSATTCVTCATGQ